MYVEELIGELTVNTMPQETIAFQDGKVEPNTVERDLDEAREPSAGSPMPASTTTTLQRRFEQEGVQKFADSFEEPLDGIRRRAGSSSPPRRREP